MKNKTLLLSLALIASLSSAFSVLKLGDGGMGTGGMQIQMMYSRMIFVPPITTEITPKNSIAITFNENLGIVYATIKRNTGMPISRSKVDTSRDTNTEIKIANLPKGSYILVITDKQGVTIKSEKFIVD